MCWCSCCWEKERGWGENGVRSKGGCSGVRSAVSEPGRIPRSPTLRSMGNKAAHDTGTATEESGKREEWGKREASICVTPTKSSWFTQYSVGNTTWKTMNTCKQRQNEPVFVKTCRKYTRIMASYNWYFSVAAQCKKLTPFQTLWEDWL